MKCCQDRQRILGLGVENIMVLAATAEHTIQVIGNNLSTISPRGQIPEARLQLLRIPFSLLRAPMIERVGQNSGDIRLGPGCEVVASQLEREARRSDQISDTDRRESSPRFAWSRRSLRKSSRSAEFVDPPRSAAKKAATSPSSAAPSDAISLLISATLMTKSRCLDFRRIQVGFSQGPNTHEIGSGAEKSLRQLLRQEQHETLKARGRSAKPQVDRDVPIAMRPKPAPAAAFTSTCPTSPTAFGLAFTRHPHIALGAGFSCPLILPSSFLIPHSSSSHASR
jgi:hypothetical protein